MWSTWFVLQNTFNLGSELFEIHLAKFEESWAEGLGGQFLSYHRKTGHAAKYLGTWLPSAESRYKLCFRPPIFCIGVFSSCFHLRHRPWAFSVQTSPSASLDMEKMRRRIWTWLAERRGVCCRTAVPAACLPLVRVGPLMRASVAPLAPPSHIVSGHLAF